MSANYKEAMMQVAASFDGASEKLLNLSSSIALAYVAGYNGWNGETKLSAATIKEQMFDVLMTNGNKKSNAYRLVNIGLKLALKVNKMTETLKQTLKTSTTQEAAMLITATIKAELSAYGIPPTLDGLVALLEGNKTQQAPTVKTAAERIIAALNSTKNEFTANELQAISDAVNARLTVKVETQNVQQAA